MFLMYKKYRINFKQWRYEKILDQKQDNKKILSKVYFVTYIIFNASMIYNLFKNYLRIIRKNHSNISTR